MATATSVKASKVGQLFFGSDFLHDHVGQIIDDPTVAILELIANSYDAGADRVEVMWPDQTGDTLSVTDNGTGMTRKEFETRWRTLKYDRVTEQGPEVVFPDGLPSKKRTAFGHNGKGRFSPLCFADEYHVETWKDGHCITVLVQITHGGPMPFRCEVLSEKTKSGHGTCISVVARRNILPSSLICELIGFKFAVDPSFVVSVNKQTVKLFNLMRITSEDVEVEGCGRVTVHRVDPLRQERTTRLKGIAWWVNRRMAATTAEIVLSELERRLSVLKDLQELIRDKGADELHELQPLFERGLWMFGPEYEAVEFTSNRSMNTVVRDFFKKGGIDASRSRPDFVVIPDSSIGFYAAAEFVRGEVSGTRKILIIELKRGGFCITQKELDQARGYAKELRAHGCAEPRTEIEAYVLGATVEPELEEVKQGQMVIKPCAYDMILNRAHARTFNLQKRIEETKPDIGHDNEIREVLEQSFDFEIGDPGKIN